MTDRWCLNKRATEDLEDYKKAQENLAVRHGVKQKCVVASTARNV